MTVLEAGTFRVSDYRKDIPNKVKLAVIARDHDFDHDPALIRRPYDTVAGDFIPPQLDPKFIVALPKPKHAEKTYGRKAGAAKTVTTRGSDVGEAARTRDITASEAIHAATIANKNGDYKGAAAILATVKKKSRLKPKKAWGKREFPKGQGFAKRKEMRT